MRTQISPAISQLGHLLSYWRQRRSLLQRVRRDALEQVLDVKLQELLKRRGSMPGLKL
jgi:hypothetical protein